MGFSLYGSLSLCHCAAQVEAVAPVAHLVLLAFTYHSIVVQVAGADLNAVATDTSARATDAARDVVNAAQILLTGKQNDVRSLCKPWGVQLRVQKRYRSMEIIKQELRMALTKRALKLKSETEAAAGSAATEHAETEVRADDALSETHTVYLRVPELGLNLCL